MKRVPSVCVYSVVYVRLCTYTMQGLNPYEVHRRKDMQTQAAKQRASLRARIEARQASQRHHTPTHTDTLCYSISQQSR